MKRTSTTKALRALCVALLATPAMAQTRYVFQADEYVSTDNNRAPQSAFSYDAGANTLTIKATGNNNIAFQMDKAKADGKYFVTGSQQYFVVEGTNLTTSPATNSYVWWFNGSNKTSQEAANYHFTTASGTTLVVWNIAQNSVMNANMDFSKPTITISSNGQGLINAIGLTSKTGTSTISNINYLEKYGLAALYPCTWTALGYTATSLTSEIKGLLSNKITEAENKLQKGANAKLSAAVEAAKASSAALSAEDYLAAYQALRALEDVVLDSEMQVAVTNAVKMKGGLHFRQDKLHVYVLFYNDKIVRVLKSYAALSAIDKLSMSVIQKYDTNIALTYENLTSDEENIIVKSQDVTVCINRSDGHISTYRADGRPLLAEKANGTRFTERNGVTAYDTYTIRTTFQLDDDEPIYGLGQIQHGDLNQRGKTILLEQENMKVCIPFFQSPKGYGLFWDNYSPTTYSDGANGTSFESTGSEIDYYVLVGNDNLDVTAQTRWLTGDAPLMPLWNFGLYQSKERYRSANETMNVIREYRRRQVPIDCVVQDWQYWGPENDHSYWNSLSFQNTEFFSNYQEMIDDIHANNAHLLISIWGNFGSNTPGYKALKPLGRMIPVISYPNAGGVEPIDVWSKTAQNTFWNLLYDGLVKKGVDAYWMDSTEPDYGKRSDSELDYVSENGRSWRTMRNSFVLGHVSGVYDHQRARQKTDANLAKKRVSILTRSGFVGQQRYAAQTWSGDITATWEVLQKQIPAALNFTACGIPYWNNDNGAFFVGYNWGNKGPFNDPAYRSLYLRWTQFSTFTGMMRFHGSGHNCEIWQLGEQDDANGDYNQVLKYIKMRYRLLPYLYSTSWQISQNHRSLMNALPLVFPSDTQCRDQKYSYMFGDAFLVCPVVNEGQTISHNYLPQGSKWFDFWTGQSLDGGQTITKQANLDIIPLYVKAGSILPWGPDVQYSTEKKWDNLELRIYPGADGDFTLYEDENDNYNYEKGQYSAIPMHWDEATQTLTIGARQGSGFPGMLETRTFNICLVNSLCATGDQPATTFTATVTYDGTEQQVKLSNDFQPEALLDVTGDYIQNPSFENGTKGWTLNVNTAWSGVNVGGGAGDPQATDGTHIFGVWDGANNKNATISQKVTLAEGDYRLTVDMHASNRENAVRVGDQQLFCGDSKALFRDQVLSPGYGDAVPMQTISLDFTVPTDATVLSLGVKTANAPAETWFKIDNFRLYRITQHASLTTDIQTPTINATTQHPSTTHHHIYDLQGRRVTNPTPGIYLVAGKKVILK